MDFFGIFDDFPCFSAISPYNSLENAVKIVTFSQIYENFTNFTFLKVRDPKIKVVQFFTAHRMTLVRASDSTNDFFGIFEDFPCFSAISPYNSLEIAVKIVKFSGN